IAKPIFNKKISERKMWSIVKSELAYHKNSILLFLAILAFAFVYFEIIAPEDWEYVIFMLVFFMINSTIAGRMREKRNRQHFRLPLSAQQIALARALTVCLPACFAFVELLLLHSAFQKNSAFSVGKISILIGISILPFMLFFIFYDLYPSFFKKYGKFLVAIFAMGLSAFMAIGILVMIKTRSGEPMPGFALTLFNLIRDYNPFAGESGWIRFLIFNLILSSITIFTFGRCKSYVES
ncbi:hypothetical protein L0Z72_13625, partial [candidate division KSB1 bacterium]|nr:hypothetical protein [candidate division KSB1 bacterium]